VFSAVKPWIELFHRREVEHIYIANHYVESSEVLKRLFVIARDMQGQPWQNVERVLELVRECLLMVPSEELTVED
jgi:hypothetical protein